MLNFPVCAIRSVAADGTDMASSRSFEVATESRRARYELTLLERSSLPLSIKVGGVANRTGRPLICGTCSCNLSGLTCVWPVEVAVVLLRGGGASEPCSEPTAGEDCEFATTPAGVFDRGGLTGKDENGPPGAEPRLGGRPRILPAIDPAVLGQAEETAGPCLLRPRDFSAVEGVNAERGSVTDDDSV